MAGNGTSWTSAAPASPGPSNYSSNSNAALTLSVFTTIANATTVVAAGQIVLITGTVECHVGTSPTACTFCIGVDSSSCASAQHSITAQNGVDSGGAITYRATGLSAASHSFAVNVSESAHTAADVASATILVQVVTQ